MFTYFGVCLQVRCNLLLHSCFTSKKILGSSCICWCLSIKFSFIFYYSVLVVVLVIAFEKKTSLKQKFVAIVLGQNNEIRYFIKRNKLARVRQTSITRQWRLRYLVEICHTRPYLLCLMKGRITLLWSEIIVVSFCIWWCFFKIIIYFQYHLRCILLHMGKLNRNSRNARILNFFLFNFLFVL